MKTKFCPMCKMEKPVDEFYIIPQQSGGRSPYCKDCQKIRAGDWKRKNVEKSRAQGKAERMRLKVEVLMYYGNGQVCCIKCGEDAPPCLTIDHIQGKGGEHRRKLGLRAGSAFYRWLRKQGFPNGFQTLCMNCQFKKLEGEQ